MKKTVINILLVLCAMSGWAQGAESSANDSICVFDGTVTNVPDGSKIIVLTPHPEYSGAYIPDTITTVKAGKFHFEKAIHKGNDCHIFNDVCGGRPLRINLCPGMKTTITGDGMESCTWTAENSCSYQKERNAYAIFKKEKLADYEALEYKHHLASKAMGCATTEDAQKAANDERHRIRELQKPLVEKYCTTMYEFIKNRDFSPIFVEELDELAYYAFNADDEKKMDEYRELYAKIPKDYNVSPVFDLKKMLYPDYKPLKAGDQVKDFVLNDHDGKPHSIMEFTGKGKYLLLETARKACLASVLDRPKETLKELHKKYADKFDVVTVALSPKEWFDHKDFPREEWVELSINETVPHQKLEEIMATYFPKDERFIFISPEGKILAKCGPDKLNEEIKKCFPFIVE